MKSNAKWTIIVLVLAMIVGVRFYWGRANGPAVVSPWPETGVACLTSTSIGPSLAFHDHPNLEIYIDGEQEIIPVNIGVVGSCTGELHTHDSTGQLHSESFQSGKELTLGQFFGVWGEDFDKEGYELEMTVTGQPSREFANLVLRDGDRIVLRYKGESNAEAQLDR